VLRRPCRNEPAPGRFEEHPSFAASGSVLPLAAPRFQWRRRRLRGRPIKRGSKGSSATYLPCNRQTCESAGRIVSTACSGFDAGRSKSILSTCARLAGRQLPYGYNRWRERRHQHRLTVRTLLGNSYRRCAGLPLTGQTNSSLRFIAVTLAFERSCLIAARSCSNTSCPKKG
jgi:hypothetical protein